MSEIYSQFDAATRQVGAYAVLKDGVFVGRVVFKYPRDGASRLYAYVQVWGATMVRGYANGYGYDKRTAAFESAAAKLHHDMSRHSQTLRGEVARIVDSFVAAGASDSGRQWQYRLEDAGYVVACVTE